ncbi:MAG: HD domain-containing protein [Actinobacteria bacterium]|nr:HD domain-containing protein [Actinomycetota bacterium]
MQLTPKIQKAINMAAEKHLGQKRKSTGRPFVVHPFSVGFLLSEFTHDEDIIAAGFLHDVLEDAKGYTFLDMKRDFGLRVAEIVKENSEDKYPGGIKNKKTTWETRKKKKLRQLKNAGRDALIVSAADKIHNLKSIIRNYEQFGEKLWKKFNAPPEKKYWYYREAVDVITKKLDGKIAKELKGVYGEALKMFEKNHGESPGKRRKTNKNLNY